MFQFIEELMTRSAEPQFHPITIDGVKSVPKHEFKVIIAVGSGVIWPRDGINLHGVRHECDGGMSNAGQKVEIDWTLVRVFEFAAFLA